MRKTVLIFLIIVLIVSTNIDKVYSANSQPIDRYSPARHGIPNTIGGYEVLAVLTNDNYVCMRSGEIRLVLRSPEQTPDLAINNFNTADFSAELGKAIGANNSKWGWDIVGPGITRDEYINEIQAAYDLFSEKGCIKSQLISEKIVYPIGGEIKVDPPFRGYAVIQNNDADKYSDDNAQSVIFFAPQYGLNQENRVGLLNNVWTDADKFLQVGFAFYYNYTEVIWTDDTAELIGQPLGVPYVPSTYYWFSITYSFDMWWMCGQGEIYVCHADPSIAGTQLKYNINTSIFVENWNSNANWYEGFTPQWQVSQARIYRNGIGQPWSSNTFWTEDACTDKYLPKQAISGSLIKDRTAYFILTGVPLYCGESPDPYPYP